MKLPEFGFLEKCKIVGKTLLVQVCLFITLLLLAWGSQALYAKLDRTEFPTPVQITDADKLDENAKGKALVDAITHQMRYELDSTFGWSINDILFNRFVLDNRAYRQYGVYHATKVLMDLYSMTIAKLGTNDRESEMLYKARLNSFAIDPRSFMFPSAESSYKKGLKLIEQYKESLDKVLTAGGTSRTPECFPNTADKRAGSVKTRQRTPATRLKKQRTILWRSQNRWSFHSENDSPLHPLLLSRCRAGCREKSLNCGLFSLITTKTTEK